MSASDPELEPVRVVGIPGSLREGSYTIATVEHALEGARGAGATVDLIDLRDLELPFCTGNEAGSTPPEDVVELRDRVQAADGIVLGTPEYHGSYSGVLKNALDLMGFDEFEGKMIGLVGVSGGRMGAQGAMGTLRDVGRALHAWVVPSQAGVPQAWQADDDETLELTDEDLLDRVRGVGEEVATYARLHKADEADAFLEAYARAAENPGGEGR